MSAASSFKRTLAIREVESNDDLLMAILVRLPPKSIFRFRCVRKGWTNIVATPFFLESYRERKKAEPGTLLAFIQKTIVVKEHPSWQHYMNILPVAETNDHHKIDTSGESLGHFIGSSNGLILCGRHPDTYYVLNPLTGRSVPLPPPQVYKSRVMTLVCEENSRELVPSYKVVVADKIHPDSGFMKGYYRSKNGEVPNTLMIETYSSKTGKWATSALAVTENLIINERPPLVVDGIIHWFVDFTKWRLAIHDINSNHVQLIELPSFETRSSNCNTARSSRDDALWFANNIIFEGCLKVWMMPLPHHMGDQNSGAGAIIPASEWILMRTVCYESLSRDPAIISANQRHEYALPFDSVFKSSLGTKCPFSLEALIPWKPMAHFALFTRGERFLICNLETKFIKMVQYNGYPTMTGGLLLDFGWYPYLEPFCLSSYAL